jgi:predicted enzyme related to lactoylglutathione lyase
LPDQHHFLSYLYFVVSKIAEMKTKLGRAVILVDNYDLAFDFYEKNFSCKKIFDMTNPQGQRFLHVAFSGNDETGIWFLKADSPLQQKLIGNQTGGQPTLVIYTNDIEELYHHVKSNGVTITEALVSGRDSKFFHCLDLYGNRLTIVGLP